MDEGQASRAGGEAPLSGGHLLSAISNRIVQIQREHYGRGPMKAKTYALDDLVVVVMRGSGFHPAGKDDDGLRRSRSHRRDAP
jgi:Na+-translocating membrane potential-generating system (MpsC)